MTNLQKVSRSCPNCAGVAVTPLPKYSHPDWNTVQCLPCQLVYLDKAPLYESLSEDMAWSKQFADEAKRRKQKEPWVSWLDQKTRWRLHIFRDDEWAYIARKISTGKVLDIGCGNQNRIPTQFTPYGIEIEKQSAEQANVEMKKCGGHVIHAPALTGLESFEDHFFDGIIMRSYLEHEANPREVLQACYNTLKPGGVIYVKVPNFDTINRIVRGINWCGFRFPDHLNYFGIRTMKQLAEAQNYQFLLVNNLTRFTNDNLHCFLQKPS